MNNIEKASLVCLDKQMQLVAKAFFVSRTKQNQIQHLSDIDCFDFDCHTSYVARVESIFEELTSQEKIIINNEYFFEEYPFWWIGTYSKRDFKKNKKKALVHFLRLFYEE